VQFRDIQPTSNQALANDHYYQMWAFRMTFNALNLVLRTLFKVEKRVGEKGVKGELKSSKISNPSISILF
jgi:hypothetical protein